jgi:hypothetical protein
MTGTIIERDGWSFFVAEVAPSREEILRTTIAAASGKSSCQCVRRSRHATTFLMPSEPGQPLTDIFIKVLDPPDRFAFSSSPRARHVEQITDAMASAGFSVPRILVRGVETASGREALVTGRMPGEGPIITLKHLGGAVAAKRAILKALGAEVARLHRAGFIHGDLTPFNLTIVRGEPPRFGFIDNERTVRNIGLCMQRRRLRNLIQLGRFALPGITRSDRLRAFRAYEIALYGRSSRRLLRRVVAMLAQRSERDRANP